MLHAVLLAAAIAPSPLVIVAPDAAPIACPVVEAASAGVAGKACGGARTTLLVIEGDAIVRRPAPPPPPVAPGPAPMRLETTISYTLDSGRPVSLSVDTAPEHIARDLITLRSAAAMLQGPGTSWQAREY